MITMDDKDLRRYVADLKTFAARAYPFATKQTINRAAFEARTAYQGRMRAELTLRNKWSERSVRVLMAKGLNVARQEARTGSEADYMYTVEFGGTVRGGGRNQPIATSYAAGQGQSTKPRTRLPRKPNRLSSIQLKRRRRAKTRAQATVFAIQDAVTTGKRYVYLDLGRRKGIFRVVGGSKRFKRGGPQGAKINMVWDLTRTSVYVPRKPLLLPATRGVQRQIPGFYLDAVKFQLKRHGIFNRR